MRSNNGYIKTDIAKSSLAKSFLRIKASFVRSLGK